MWLPMLVFGGKGGSASAGKGTALARLLPVLAHALFRASGPLAA